MNLEGPLPIGDVRRIDAKLAELHVVDELGMVLGSDLPAGPGSTPC